MVKPLDPYVPPPAPEPSTVAPLVLEPRGRCSICVQPVIQVAGIWTHVVEPDPPHPVMLMVEP